ncbi:MAG: type II toxin-antitoxin system VapC family toxin [Alcanivorax sp.]|nr:type II toxin-antitoxin system VapC family toxin [Alcanivorax sp.]
MIILDTNVLSELMRPLPDTGVTTWTDRQPQSALFTTTVTQGELLYGVAILPEGERKRALEDTVRQILATHFNTRLLPFDHTAAEAYAHIAASRRRDGNPISQFDAMIAAIAASRGAALATRNVKDFAGCGIEVINPWEA